MKSILLVPVLAAMLAMPAAAEPYVAEHTQPHATTADIDAQVRRNNEAGRASYEAIAKAGGCNADFLPPSVFSYCWARMINGDTNAPIGASMGGSDGGSDGGSAD